MVRPMGLTGVYEITPKKHGDLRGFFSETWSRPAFAAQNLNFDFVQDNHSLSAAVGTLRGLHFQAPPMAQDKLVRCLRGRVFVVVVDIRKGSPHFGCWVGLELSAEAWNQVLVPKGFAHGFVTLEPDTEVAYKVTEAYSPEHDRSIHYADPTIGIKWPRLEVPFQLSPRDNAGAALGQIDTGFIYP